MDSACPSQGQTRVLGVDLLSLLAGLLPASHSWVETLPVCTWRVAPPTMSLMTHWENGLLSLPVIQDSVVAEVLEPKGEIFKLGHTLSWFHSWEAEAAR